MLQQLHESACATFRTSRDVRFESGLRTKADVSLGDRHLKKDNGDDRSDRSPLANCHLIVCYGGPGLFDKHLASTVHFVDDEISGWLQRHEQRGRARSRCLLAIREATSV
jgi:hypothetical protein